MTWTTPVAVTTGELYTAAKYNAQVKDDLLHLRADSSLKRLPAALWANVDALGLAFGSSGATAYAAHGFSNTGQTYITTVIDLTEAWVGATHAAIIHFSGNTSSASTIDWSLTYSYIDQDATMISAGNTLSASLAGPAAANDHERGSLGSLVDPLTYANRVVRLNLSRNGGADAYAGNALFMLLEIV